MELEKRFLFSSDLAVDYAGQSPKFRGYAAIFNSPSEVITERGKRFKEVIRSGSFSDALPTADVRALINHNPDLILGRTRSGDLKIEQDAKGLRFECDIDPELSYAKDLRRNIEKGRISGCSFAFSVGKGDSHWRDEGGMAFHDIHRISSISDVSIVTYPAYSTTSVSVRCIQDMEEYEAELKRMLDLEEFLAGYSKYSQ